MQIVYIDLQNYQACLIKIILMAIKNKYGIK